MTLHIIFRRSEGRLIFYYLSLFIGGACLAYPTYFNVDFIETVYFNFGLLLFVRVNIGKNLWVFNLIMDSTSSYVSLLIVPSSRSEYHSLTDSY